MLGARWLMAICDVLRDHDARLDAAAVLGVLLLVFGASAQEAQPPQPPRVDQYGDSLPEGAVARLGASRYLLGDNAHLVAISRDGGLVATYRTSRIYFAGSPRRAASVEVWDVPTGRKVREFFAKYYYTPVSAQFSPDASKIVIASKDSGAINVYFTSTGKLQYSLQLSSGRNTTLSSDSRLVAHSDSDHKIHIWDVALKKRLATLPGHGTTLSSLAFSGDSTRLVTVGGDRTIRLWDVQSAEEVLLIRVERLDGPVAVSHDGELTAYVDKGVLHVWSAARQRRLHRPRVAATAVFTFDPAGRRIAVFGEAQRVAGRLREPLHYVEAASGDVVAGIDDWPLRPCLHSGDGRVAAGGKSTILAWDAQTGRLLTERRDPPARVTTLDWSPRGDLLLAYRSRQAKTSLWNPLAGRPEGQWDRVGGPPTFSPDGQSVFTRWFYGIRVTDLAGGEEEFVADDQSNRNMAIDPRRRRDAVAARFEGPRQMTISADGSKLAVWRNGQLQLWSVAGDGKPAYLGALPEAPSDSDGPRRPGRTFTAMGLSGDGRTLATGYHRGEVALWRTERKGRLKRIASHRFDSAAANDNAADNTAARHEPITLIRWMESKRAFLVVRRWRRIRLLDPRQNTFVTGYDDLPYFRKLAVSNDEQYLALLLQDQSISLWEIESRQIVLRLHDDQLRQQGVVDAFCFSPAGRYLASGHSNSLIYTWNLRPADLAMPKPGGELTSDQLDASWGALHSADAAAAYRAVWRLGDFPRQSVASLRARLPSGDSGAADGASAAGSVTRLGWLRAIQVLQRIDAAGATQLLDALTEHRSVDVSLAAQAALRRRGVTLKTMP